ncbi:MAG: HAD family hydrolase [Candidatus Thorarchaeota archaeon]|jgi:HAD superfamily hydrolase (TIGR01549 family)
MRIRAILFDLHHTLTKFHEHPIDVVRRVSKECGVDIHSFSNEEMEEAHLSADKWFKRFQIESNVDSHHGGSPDHWIEQNRIMYEALGLDGIADDILLEVEQRFKDELLGKEEFTEDSKKTIKSLHARGYPIGIVTRRFDDPQFLIAKAKLSKYISAIQWSGIIGYAKPSPYTLLQAADDLGMNPKLCAYVGNLVDADITASQRAQMLPILLTWANPDQVDLAPEGTIIKSSPLELLNMFKGPDTPVELT